MNVALQRRNTLPSLPNLTAVIMKLRGAKKSRSSSVFGASSASSLPGCCLGLVLEGEVSVVRMAKGRAQQKCRPRHLLLFTDRLLLCRVGKDQVKEQTPVSEMWLAEPGEDQPDAAQQLLIGWPLVNYTVRFESQDAKLLWLRVLRK